MKCEHCKLELVAGEIQPSHSPCWYEKGAFEIQYGVKVAVVHTTERCRDRLKAMLADDDRILRDSVPERWKKTTSAVGGAQGYIAELEGSLETFVSCADKNACSHCYEIAMTVLGLRETSGEKSE